MGEESGKSERASPGGLPVEVSLQLVDLGHIPFVGYAQLVGDLASVILVSWVWRGWGFKPMLAALRAKPLICEMRPAGSPARGFPKFCEIRPEGAPARGLPNFAKFSRLAHPHEVLQNL